MTTAHVELGLSPVEFYAITPRMFSALLKRSREKVSADREHTEFMFAQLTSWVVNTGFRSTEDPTEAKDFMPSEWRRSKASTPSTPITGEELVDKLRLIFPSP